MNEIFVGILENLTRKMRGKNFQRSMLGYCKLILQKMSFSKKLFLKEYRKSLSYLSEEEQMELKQWVRNHQSGVLNAAPAWVRKKDRA
jgi:hypothetical protein